MEIRLPTVVSIGSAPRLSKSNLPKLPFRKSKHAAAAVLAVLGVAVWVVLWMVM
jgi:hypothetical protein